MTASGPVRYGLATRVLHWTTVVLLVVQFVLGYAIEDAGDWLDWLVEGRFGGEDEGLVVLHAGVGVAILVVATVRLLWRLATPLPPWAPGLSPRERRLTTVVERVLYTTLFWIPLSGLGLLLLSGEDWDIGPDREFVAPLEVFDDSTWLVLHVVGHVVFFAAVAIHVGMVLRHQFLLRDRLLHRML